MYNQSCNIMERDAFVLSLYFYFFFHYPFWSNNSYFFLFLVFTRSTTLEVSVFCLLYVADGTILFFIDETQVDGRQDI